MESEHLVMEGKLHRLTKAQMARRKKRRAFTKRIRALHKQLLKEVVNEYRYYELSRAA